MKRAAKYCLITLLVVPVLSGVFGQAMGGGILQPARKRLSPEQTQQADAAFGRVDARREDFDVRADDGVLLRGWKVRPRTPNSDWVLLYHGVSDNRTGVLGHAEMLLRNGYSVLMMDARAHGESGGDLATYGWLERHDTRAITEALYKTEPIHCLFALGESMGASIALQSAGVETRIDGVVAESAFANLREVSYDYAGLHISHWLGRTLFRPALWFSLPSIEKKGGFRARDVSPERAVAERKFPVLLICGTGDRTIPCRHSKRIYEAAVGPKEFWQVPGAAHSAALGSAPREFERRVITFLFEIHMQKEPSGRGKGETSSARVLNDQQGDVVGLRSAGSELLDGLEDGNSKLLRR